VTSPAPRPANLHAAVAAAIAAQTNERPTWVDPALEAVHRAMTDEFWFEGLPKLQQTRIWTQREQLIAAGFLAATADLEGGAA
jgi:hypothetical protein